MNKYRGSSNSVSMHPSWNGTMDNVLPEPVLPWMKSESRNSLGSRSSIDGASLHVMKRYTPDPNLKKKQRWTKHKWWLLLSNSLLFCYGLGIMLLSVLTYFKFFQRADTIIVGQRVILDLIFSTGIVCLFTSFVGYAGIMLNNRSLLTIYNLLLWPSFGMIAAIGYISYRKNKWNIEGKLSYQWHYQLDADARARVQVNLHCCGYKSFTDYHERSNKCFPRTLLHGCKFKYQTFTKDVLTITWTVAFSIIPAHLFVMFSALLCSNHINRKFGKGLPPKIYRLDYQGIQASTANSSAINIHSMSH
ncbi:tetraspanin Tsp2 [Pilobolus umbonatus]|nr:tetraspanin Tsp2 [Pilobolus umbonatus]